MDSFNIISNIVLERECKLLTTYDEFMDKLQNCKYKYKSYHFVNIDIIGLCGHKSTVMFSNFKVRNTGLYCKSCSLQNASKRLKENNLNTHVIEYNSINILKSKLEKDFIIKRTPEGCFADLIIKPIPNDGNKWLQVQVKSCSGMTKGMYSFGRIQKSYKDMVIVFISIEDSKIWIMTYNDIQHTKKVNISRRSIYNKYNVTDENILSIMLNLYKTLDCVEESFAMKPNAQLSQREIEYFQKREKYIPLLTYTYPEIQNSHTDLLINNKKVQDKVCGFNNKKKSLVFWLSPNNGKHDNKRKFRTYRLGENDYYWIHSSIDDRFWVFPETVLLSHNLISSSDKTENRKYVFINYKLRPWMKDYEYNYMDEKINDKMLDLLK